MPDIGLFAETDIEVPFYDLDAMGVVWHGNYFRYFELVRCALLDRIGFGYLQMQQSGYAWPIIDTRVKFIRPLVYQQRVRVRAAVAEYENRLKINYEIRDLADDARTTRGHTIQVAVDAHTRELCFVSPPALVERILACR